MLSLGLCVRGPQAQGWMPPSTLSNRSARNPLTTAVFSNTAELCEKSQHQGLRLNEVARVDLVFEPFKEGEGICAKALIVTERSHKLQEEYCDGLERLLSFLAGHSGPKDFKRVDEAIE